jgi:type IV pilus assembly protein PilY1
VKLSLMCVATACWGVLTMTALHADDIDVYLGSGATGPGDGCSTEVDTTLVAPSFSSNRQLQAQAAGDIFFPLFEPGPGLRWRGNVKKLKVARLEEVDPDSGDVTVRELVVQAPMGSPPRAGLAADGGILADALTFWTDPGAADVLAFDATKGEVSGRDGRSVARGGAGQQVPGFQQARVGAGNSEPGARQLFTRDPALPDQLIALDAVAGTAQLGPYLDSDDRLAQEQEIALIGWIRGRDAFDEDGDGDRVESRPWLMGDLIHSRPLVISYGARPGTRYSDDNPDVRLFFGTNDGIFHIVRNTLGQGVDKESGGESWAFIPLELLAMQSQLASNQALVPHRHLYGMDGEALALIQDRDLDGNIEPGQGDLVWVFVGQRRGGRAIYAFDMTNPDNPQFKWQISHRTPGFEQLAMTFSTPRVARLDLGSVTPSPVLIFGGGYNGGWNGDARVGKDAGSGSDLIGNAIYVVDADTGELVWKAIGPDGGSAPVPGSTIHFVPALTDSIPSPLTVVDADDDGIADRAYVGDSGGNVWRVQFGERAGQEPGVTGTGPATWRVSRLAALGGEGSDDRRFFHAPDFVRSRDSAGLYHGILVVSGNRAAPADTGVNNYAYLLKDRLAMSGSESGDPPAPLSLNDLADVTSACGLQEQAACAPADLAHGWKLALAAPGEKGVSSPLVSNGRVLFTSYVPADDAGPEACSPALGSGRAYLVKLANGSAGLPPAGELEPPGARYRHVDIGPGIPAEVVPYGDRVLVPGKGIDGSPFVTIPGPTRWRVYWREEGVDFP